MSSAGKHSRNQSKSRLRASLAPASCAMRHSCASRSSRTNIMNRRTTTTTLMSMALLCLAVSLPAGSAVAQQKQQVSFKVPAENNKYGPQQNIQVGDVPNHIVRVFEVHYSFTANAPSINGLKLVEAWQRGLADVSDGAG